MLLRKLARLKPTNRLYTSTKPTPTNLNPESYDLVVIGGGSGGLACAKEASKCGAKVAVLNYVQKTTAGTSWGLGGTCVNVGCIPKKLFHHAALMGKQVMQNTEPFGWKNMGHEHDWEKLTTNVQAHIKTLNTSYEKSLEDVNVKYINGKGKLLSTKMIQVTNSERGQNFNIIGKKIVLAVGGTPSYPAFIDNAKDVGITSDDIFSLKKKPGKTLIVGGGYIAMETAGFLNSLGVDTTVMLRSEPLSGFDRECVEKIVSNMTSEGVKFLNFCKPVSFFKFGNTHTEVHYLRDGMDNIDDFENIIFATGRTAQTKNLGLENVGGIKISPTGKIVTTEDLMTNSNIYAVGDIVEGSKELTPVAIQQGKLLAKYLFEGTSFNAMDAETVPTTIFTPLEYGSCGLSEEQARRKYGDSITVFKKNFNILENQLSASLSGEQGFVKLICRAHNVNEDIVIGFHFLGPHAAEVTQGVAVAMRAGATKQHFDDTFGIHPSNAEHMTTLEKDADSAEC